SASASRSHGTSYSTSVATTGSGPLRPLTQTCAASTTVPSTRDRQPCIPIVAWCRAELERRWGRPLLKAGTDLRKKHHVDHLGLHPQKRPAGHYDGPGLHYVGFLVPVGRITTAQMRGVADLAERYGSGDICLTVGQN